MYSRKVKVAASRIKKRIVVHGNCCKQNDEKLFFKMQNWGGGGLPFRLFFVIMEMYILSKPKCFIVA